MAGIAKADENVVSPPQNPVIATSRTCASGATEKVIRHKSCDATSDGVCGHGGPRPIGGVVAPHGYSAMYRTTQPMAPKIEIRNRVIDGASTDLARGHNTTCNRAESNEEAPADTDVPDCGHIDEET